MRLAAYRGGVALDNLNGRQAAYIGSVGAGFNVERLMKGVLDKETARYMRFGVYDAGPASVGTISIAKSDDRLLFDSYSSFPADSLPNSPTDPDAVFTRILPMEVGGRVWNIHFEAPKAAIIDPIDTLLPWMVLGGGLLSSFLLFGMTYSLASARDRAIAIANEITRDLRASTEQLQALSRRLVDIQESERRQFSRELHDRIGQNLTALGINLDILRSQCNGGSGADMQSRLADSAALLESTAGAVENVMSELRPPMLDDYGLLPALQWYGNEFAGRTGIEVKVQGDEHMARLEPATEIALFRIAQEALNNIAKHAQAHVVDVVLQRHDSNWVMTVTDDGVGLDTASSASARRRHGLGMMTMRERTQAVGGHFEIGGARGSGTRVKVQVPV